MKINIASLSGLLFFICAAFSNGSLAREGSDAEAALLVEEFTLVTGVTEKFLFVARLSRDGNELVYDSSFGIRPGALTTGIFGDIPDATAVGTDSANRIYVAGTTFLKQGNSLPNRRSLFVAKFNENGRLDTTFSNQGVAHLSLPHQGYEQLLPDEIKIFEDPDTNRSYIYISGEVALKQQTGTFVYQPFLMRLDDDGLPDHTFAEEGSIVFRKLTGFKGSGLAIDDRKNVYTGLSGGESGKAASRAFNGTRIFGGVTDDIPFRTSKFHDMSLYSEQDKLLVVTRLIDAESPADGGTSIVRYLPDGSMDQQFGDQGVFRSDFNIGFPLLIDTDLSVAGKIYALSRVGLYGAGIEAMDIEGSMDEDFSGDGKRVLFSDLVDEEIQPTGIAHNNTLPPNLELLYISAHYKRQSPGKKAAALVFSLDTRGEIKLAQAGSGRRGFHYFPVFLDRKGDLIDFGKIRNVETAAITADGRGRPILVGTVTVAN